MILRRLLLFEKLLITGLYLKNIENNFWTKLIKLNFMVLILLLTISFTPWPIEVFVYLIMLIPYLRITFIKSRRLVKWKRKINDCDFIYINNTDYDGCARERYFKELLAIIFRCFVFVIFTTIFFYNEFSLYAPVFSRHTQNSIENYLLIYSMSIPLFGLLSLKAKGLRKQIGILLFTNPVILLFILFVLIGQIPVQNPQDIFFFGQGALGSFLIIFTQAGIEKRFIVDCIIYATIQQVIFSIFQPAYRVEKGKLAVEVVAFTFGAVSIIGLFLSTEISFALYKYIERTAYIGKDYFGLIGISNSGEFKLFFETTFKYIVLPSSFCSTIPLIIFKIREYLNKNRGNKLFEKTIKMGSSLEKSKILRKAIYYGGSSIKNLILMSQNFQSELIYLTSNKYKRKSLSVRKIEKIRRRVIIFFIEKLNSLKLIYEKSKLKIPDIKKELEGVIFHWKYMKREVIIFLSFSIVICTAIFYFLLKFYTKENLDNLLLIVTNISRIIYSKYVGLFNDNISLANYSLFIIYYLLFILYFILIRRKN